ncbi:MAG: DUF4238 domain-containing protein [Luteococcus sp.]|uniref:DUF4238 domain-containing protein n=1 Tax=Luteococcus sp. TaxID=1969402 RepID=UPI0026493E4E|nr:DUF4238 domain-containing protein [Luteococcus sp.]MDN5563678.1 DUF4238 domain-containing protein [Luteococcus sp.]
MSLAKGHHIVPRRYLERFADGHGRVLEVPFGRQPHHIAIRKAARETDFYTTTQSDGEKTDIYERVLAQLEEDSFPGIEATDREWPLEPDRRALAAGWVALQFLRTHLIRDVHSQVGHHVLRQELSPAASEARVAELIRSFPEFDALAVRTHYSKMEELVRQDFDGWIGSTDGHMRAIDQYFPGIANGLMQRQWLLYRYTRRSMVTSDRPVGMWSPGGQLVGIGTAEIVTFPLSRRSALVMRSTPGKDGFGATTTRTANAINQITVLSAARSVYHHPEDSPMTGLVVPSAPRKRVQIFEGESPGVESEG